MKKNERTLASHFGRENAFKVWAFDTFYGLSGCIRVFIEVFTRKSQGERYFSFSTCVFMLVVFASLPFWGGIFLSNPFDGSAYDRVGPSFWGIIGKHFLYFAYLGVYFYFCLKRRKEVKQEPSVFDFAKYSLCTGFVDDRILNITFNGRKATLREIETFFEPLIFFVPGLLLALIGQSLGYFLIFCSVTYSVGYCAAYHNGDNRIMDIIDKWIIQQQLMDVVVDGKSKAKAKGFGFTGRMPDDPDLRSRVGRDMLGDDDFEDVH